MIRNLRKFLKHWKRLTLVALALMLLGATVLFAIVHRVEAAAERLRTTDTLEPQEFALLLGCAPRLKNGRVNYYYQFRIDAAAELYRAGKFRKIVVSGGTSPTTDEPGSMRKDLIERGIPAEAILTDRTGRSTFESLRTMKYYFRCSRFVIITQRRHNIRALYMAESLGMDPVGFAARDVRYLRYSWRNWHTVNLFYELPAAVKAWLSMARIGAVCKCPVEPY